MSCNILEKVEGATKSCLSQAPWVHYVSEEEAVGQVPCCTLHCTPAGQVPQPPLQLGSQVCRLQQFAFRSQPFWRWDYWLEVRGLNLHFKPPIDLQVLTLFSALYWGRKFVFSPLVSFFLFPSCLCFEMKLTIWWDPWPFLDSLCQLTCFLKLKAVSFVYIYKRQRSSGVWM